MTYINFLLDHALYILAAFLVLMIIAGGGILLGAIIDTEPSYLKEDGEGEITSEDIKRIMGRAYERDKV